MELQTYAQHNEDIVGVMIEPVQCAKKKINYDSRYRCIISQLDVMIELVRQQPERKLTTEFDHLLYDMVHHIGSENRFMELVDYPQTTKHRNHHYHIFVITNDLNQRFRDGHDVTPHELANIRLLWLVHIQIHDRAFEEFLAF